MNFLQLCQKVRLRSGLSGSGPSAVTNQSGVYEQIVDWVNLAWTLIQNDRPDWRWMVQSFSFNTTDSLGNYTASSIGLTDFGAWERDSFRIYRTSTGVSDERVLPWIDYDAWRGLYSTGTQTDNYPLHFTIKPDQSIQIAPVPDGAYTVRGEYRQTAVELSANTDTPGVPSRFHDLIVWRALILYAAHFEDSTTYSTATTEYNALYAALLRDQTPQIIDGSEPLGC